MSGYWYGKVNGQDDFGSDIGSTFIDGRTQQGPWAIMVPDNWKRHGVGRLGTGCGQKYEKQKDGRWKKILG